MTGDAAEADNAAAERKPGQPASGRRPSSIGWWLSGVATAIWVLAVVATGQLGRVAGHWESALTMLFGSFLAGSSPEGGGAVAFPVFTKALDVPAPVARTFGLSIQAVGMTMASLSILASGRAYHRRTVVIGIAVGIPALIVGVWLFGDGSAVFRPSLVPVPWVKATFSIVLATTSILMVRHLRHGAQDHQALPWSRRLDLLVAAAAIGGGFLSSMTGTGANILVFLVLVVLADVGPKQALTSAIMVMAAVSVAGLAVLGLADGQLAVAVEADRVVSVGGVAVDLAVSQADLLGLWLAAVPVVVWGAPLGALAASVVAERHLVRFVAALAVIEVATTVLLVPEIRTEPGLLVYLAVGLAVLPAAFLGLRARRQRLLAGADPDQAHGRGLDPEPGADARVSAHEVPRAHP